MRMQGLYYKLNAEDQKVYSDWLRITFTLWAFVLVVGVTVCTILALDASTTPEQRAELLQQSAAFP